MANSTAPGKPKRSRGCLWGCGGCLGLIAASLCLMVAGYFVLRALRPNPTELLSGASDPVAEAAVESALVSAGVQGAKVTVIPLKGSDQQLVYVVFDEASGFSMEGLAQGGDQGLANALLQLDAANRSQGLNLGPVALEYRDETGAPLLVVATDQENIGAYAAGQISREELLAGTDIDLTNLLGGIDALYNAAGQ